MIFTHVVASITNLTLFIIDYYLIEWMNHNLLTYSLTSWWEFKLLLVFVNYGSDCYKHLPTKFFWWHIFTYLEQISRSKIVGLCKCMFDVIRHCQTVFQSDSLFWIPISKVQELWDFRLFHILLALGILTIIIDM